MRRFRSVNGVWAISSVAPADRKWRSGPVPLCPMAKIDRATLGQSQLFVKLSPNRHCLAIFGNAQDVSYSIISPNFTSLTSVQLLSFISVPMTSLTNVSYQIRVRWVHGVGDPSAHGRQSKKRLVGHILVFLDPCSSPQHKFENLNKIVLSQPTIRLPWKFGEAVSVINL